jgi:cation diffusion facilitator family transporter
MPTRSGPPPSRPDDRFRTGRRVAIAGLAVSAFLAALNVIVGLYAGSTSVVATGLELLADVMASSIILIGMIVGGRPADANHPYGHGRVETLAGFVVGIVVLGGGVAICYRSLQAIGELHAPPRGFAVVSLLVAIALRAVMSMIKFRVGRRIQSGSLVADAWNDAVDILSATAALTAVGLTLYDPARFLAADHYGGFTVGLIVAVTGIRIAREASMELVDTMPEPGMAEEIRRAAAAVPGVLGVEKVHARKTGLQYHVDLHIEVAPSLTVEASHAISGHVRSAVRAELPWVADVLVHVEPAAAPAQRTAER